MHCFVMKALTREGTWFEFEITDAPTRFDDTGFVLLAKPNSPKLLLDKLRRGVPEYGVYEGDIINAEGQRWLVCYERGFYAINEQYITRFLDSFDEFKIAGTCFDSEFRVPISMRSKHLFKYNNTIFRIEDILGSYDKSALILRCCSNPVPSADIQQYCGITRDKNRIFLGDAVGDATVVLHKGRIVLADDTGYRDFADGGRL